MLNTLKIYEELKETLEPTAARKIAEILGTIYEELKNTVTKEDFRDLKSVVVELAQAQKNTEQRLEELAQAQKNTEEELKELIREHQKTREQLGGLSDTVGYYLEDLSYQTLPLILKQDAKIKIDGYLERKFIEYPDGREDEINIYGKGKIDGKEIYIIGEAKSQIGKKDVEAFIKILKRVKDYLGKNIFPVMVCYMIHPKVERYIKEKYSEIAIYKSFELKRREGIYKT